MSSQDPNSPEKAIKPPPTNHGVGPPPFRSVDLRFFY